MTAPDHRPYLLPTDIREIGDVLRVLWIHGDGKAIEAWQEITDRMSRERRQACERGAEDCERRLAELGPEPEEPTIDIWGTEALRARLRESALAFRAAARARD